MARGFARPQRPLSKPGAESSRWRCNANLEFCVDFAEAYQVGVEEAQGECLARIQARFRQ